MEKVAKLKNKISEFIDPSILQGAGIAFIVKVLGAGASFGLQVVLARLLSLENYGSYTYIMAWIGMLSGFTSLGFTTSLIRFIPEYLKKKEYGKLKGVLINSLLITVFCSSIFAGLGLLLMFVAGNTSIGGTNTIYLYACGIFIGTALVKLFSSIEKGKKRMFMATAPLQFFRKILIGLGIFFLWYFNKNLNDKTALICTLLAVTLLVVWHLLSLNKGLPAKVFKDSPSYSTKEWLKVSFPLLLINGFLLILNRTDIIMLGIFSTKAQVGIYNIAYKVASMVNFILIAVNAIAAPTISELYHQDKMKKLQEFAKRIAHLVFWPTLVIAVVLILSSGFVLSIFGTEFVDAKVLLFILLVGQLMNACVGSVGYYLNMTGHENDSAKVFGTAALVNIIFNPLAIYFFGAVGAAIVTAFSTGMWNIWLYFLVKKRVGIKSTFIGI